MWTNSDYNELQPFYEWLDQHGSTQLYGGTEFEEDQDTQDGLLDWFFWRKVVDNRKFGAYFRRVLNIYARQYYQLLRVETTEIDPLVGNYLERQILRKGSRAETGNENTTERGTNNNKTTSKGSNTETGQRPGIAKPIRKQSMVKLRKQPSAAATVWPWIGLTLVPRMKPKA